MPRNLARREEADQGHFCTTGGQCVLHDLQLG
jgi:hypothetical protein